MKVNTRGLNKAITKISRALGKNGSKFLVGLGIGGFASSVVLAIMATPKAVMEVEEKKYAENKESLTAKETVSVAWKHYIPTIGMMTLSTACIIGGTKLSSRQNAALAAAYSVASQTLHDYKEKLPEIIGDDKVQEVQNAVAQKQIDNIPSQKKESVKTSEDDIPLYDQWSGRLFWVTFNELDSAVNNINRSMLLDGSANMADLYYELNEEPTKTSEDLGWSMEKDGFVELRKSDTGVLKDGMPCLMLNCNKPPRYNYWS